MTTETCGCSRVIGSARSFGWPDSIIPLLHGRRVPYESSGKRGQACDADRALEPERLRVRARIASDERGGAAGESNGDDPLDGRTQAKLQMRGGAETQHGGEPASER